MTTNIDRVADVIYRETGDSYLVAQLTQALAAADLLAPDLPVPDEKGRFFPASGWNYGHVRRGVVHHPERGPEPYVRIARGAHSITLTRAEALELAGILTAAAMEEA